MDTKDCQPLFKEILKFYKNLGMNIEQQIPMLLVEREATLPSFFVPFVYPLFFVLMFYF
jgi:hypothetical protein